MITVVEKVIALQDVDIFSDVHTEWLSHIAMVAEEITFGTGEAIYREADPPTAMYLVLSGRVRLHRGDRVVTEAGVGEAFGTWSLLDDEPMVATATAVEETVALRIDKEDFVDLLADHVEIAQGILKGMVGRMRRLMGRVGADGTA